MAIFKNDGSWYYLGIRDRLDVYVKMNNCIYVDINGQIVSSPEEVEMLKQANDRIKKIIHE